MENKDEKIINKEENDDDDVPTRKNCDGDALTRNYGDDAQRRMCDLSLMKMNYDGGDDVCGASFY